MLVSYPLRKRQRLCGVRIVTLPGLSPPTMRPTPNAIVHRAAGKQAQSGHECLWCPQPATGAAADEQVRQACATRQKAFRGAVYATDDPPANDGERTHSVSHVAAICSLSDTIRYHSNLLSCSFREFIYTVNEDTPFCWLCQQGSSRTFARAFMP